MIWFQRTIDKNPLKIEVSTWGGEKKRGDLSKAEACQIFERCRDSQEGEQQSGVVQGNKRNA